MRIAILGAALVATTACTPQSSGITFNDLTSKASAGIRDYESWVAIDNQLEKGDRFPAGLCLAAVVLEAKLADTSTANAGVSIPLAAPSAGLTGLFGYSFVQIEDGTDKIEVPMRVRYQSPPKYAADLARAKAKSGEPGVLAKQNGIVNADLDGFLPKLGKIREKRSETSDGVRTPRMSDGTKVPGFTTRTDLGAELWRIREGIHDMVANSPDGMILFPGDMTFVREYRLVKRNTVSLTLNLATGASGNAGRVETTSDSNRLAIFFVQNASADIMACDQTSLAKVKWEDIKFSKALLAEPQFPK
ncbi:MAG: hypothetical protein AAGB15_13600 [Pseudomonadota bacterium]